MEMPKFDISNLELPKFELPKMELPKMELPKMELPNIDMPELPANIDLPSADEVVEMAKDGMHIAVGSGVVAVKAVQDAGRDIQARVSDIDLPDFPADIDPAEWATEAVAAGRKGFDKVVETVTNLGEVPAVQAIDEQVQAMEDRMDTVLDAVETKLPNPAQFMLTTVREAAKDSADQARTLIGLSA